MRKSRIITKSDQAGEYEIEVFDADNPKKVIVCSHGNGVRRWDGEHFFHNVANHYPEFTFYLVDQNQVVADGCKLNPLPILVRRVQGVLELARQEHNEPIVVMGHSMGCGVISQMNLDGVDKVIFVAPAAGDYKQKLIDRHGPEVFEKGAVTETGEGEKKYITPEYANSVKAIDWEQEYPKLLQRYKNVHVFESGDEEIVGEERFIHRNMPFASYKIIPGAQHNFAGKPLEDLYKELDKLL